VEQRVSRALQLVAHGTTLRKASEREEAPYASLNKAWKAMGGDIDGPAWKAFKESLPPVPAPAPAPTKDAAAESPLAPRLKRKANRHGDAVPYGQHGAWGMVREGVKEMTSKIAAGEVDAPEAEEQLKAAGVRYSARQLARRARLAPGESPVKAGGQGLLRDEVKDEVHEEIVILRKHDIPVSKGMVKVMLLSKMPDAEQDEKFPRGITDEVYYGFLDDKDMNTEQTKPLESERDLWLTSTVRRSYFETAPRPLALSPSRPLALSPSRPLDL
jgi:hypothetical protein